MESLGRLFQLCIDGMKMEFVIYGYTISMWQIFVFDIVASIMIYIIMGVIRDE